MVIVEFGREPFRNACDEAERLMASKSNCLSFSEASCQGGCLFSGVVSEKRSSPQPASEEPVESIGCKWSRRRVCIFAKEVVCYEQENVSQTIS